MSRKVVAECVRAAIRLRRFTVMQLARSVGMSENGTRQWISTMAEAGLIVQAGTVPREKLEGSYAAGKQHLYLYEWIGTPESEWEERALSAEAALAELVTLRAIKDECLRVRQLRPYCITKVYPLSVHEAEADYKKRKPAAWAQARNILARRAGGKP